MRASDFYSMSAFNKAAEFLIPEIIMRGANDATRIEQLNIIALRYFYIADLSPKQIEALNVIRAVGWDFKTNGRFRFGSKDFNVD